MKKVEIFDGEQLFDKPVLYPMQNPVCTLQGRAADGQKAFVPLDMDLLSRHLLFLGGIGTGKTNAFYQIIRQLRSSLTGDDIVILFDTKGDFYRSFYRSGDIVISNDETATGPDGKDYWNIFYEIERDDHMEENIVEVSKSLFSQKLEKTNQPFFPNAAKDLFGAVLTHFCRNQDTLKGNNKKLGGRNP